jgi:hypothetical protein
VALIRTDVSEDLIRTARRHFPEDDNHHSHRRGNLKSYMFFINLFFYNI